MDDRITLDVTDNIASMCQKAEDVMRACPTRADIYARGNCLVRIIPTIRGHAIHSITPASLASILSGAIRWQKCKKKGDEMEAYAVMPPREVVAALHAAGSWRLRELRGLLQAPTLRDDGTLLIEPGYDEATGLFLAPSSSAKGVKVRQEPTQDDAMRALEFLDSVFIDFPFAGQRFQSTCYAALMTLILRPTIERSVPIFAVEAPARGTGKSNLVSMIGILATGSNPVVTPRPRDDHEDAKRLTIQVQKGDFMIFIDNVVGRFGSEYLAALITAPDWGDRVIGTSEVGPWLNHTVWFVTGNNLSFHQEITRRVLSIFLDSHMEHPTERRTFAHPDFRKFAMDVRPKVLSACLTILRGYVCAGRPLANTPTLPAFSNFEKWSRWVREPLIWLGREDPFLTQSRIKEEDDTEEQQFGRAMAAWWNHYGRTPATLRDAILCNDTELTDALQVLAPGKGRDPIDARILGYIFHRNKAHPLAGFVCNLDKKTNRGQSYRIERVENQPSLGLVETPFPGDSAA